MNIENIKIKKVSYDRVEIIYGVHKCMAMHAYFQNLEEGWESCETFVYDLPIALKKYESLLLDAARKHLPKEWRSEFLSLEEEEGLVPKRPGVLPMHPCHLRQGHPSFK